MHWFLKLLIYPLLEALHPRVIVEVGVEVGTVTGPLLRWAQEHHAVVHAIDPDPTLNVDRLVAEHPEQLHFHRSKSLEVLDEIPGVDLALIDGDHNWYTVINELRALESRASEDEREPPVILLHDVGWPYGQRDLYYDPSAIPAAHRQPHARLGVAPGRVELGPGLNEHLENALLEGTPANGVLCAVEDFVAESRTQWRMWSIPGLSGMAILASAAVLEASAPLRELLDSIDTPEFLRAHCEAIERARIASDCRRAGILRRLAENQLKQITRSDDPHEEVALRRRVRELSEQVRNLEGRLERIDELEEQVRLLTSAAAAAPTASEGGTGGGDLQEQEGSVVAVAAPEPEREAWRTLLDLYLPVLELALPCEDGRDPLSPPYPLDLHGVLCGEDEEQEPDRPSVDVVVCVHDALQELRLCLWSLLAKSRRRLRLILVNDGSSEATTRFVQAFADRHPAVTLIHREPPHGYTLAANHGLKASGGDYVVLLNSDTVLPEGWLDRVLAHGETHPELGILGPLSNAATHQSVPQVSDAGAWVVNPLPDWLTVDGMNLVLQRGAPATDTRLPFLNGFCYAIKREVIDVVGSLDEERFAGGYCEENDYSHRARRAGFELGVLDDVYVYHAKSRSFGPEGRAELARRNYESFLEKHGREEIAGLVSALEADVSLEPVRAAVAELTESPTAIAPLLRPDGEEGLSVVFLLPGLAHGGSGGAHSIYQEVRGLRDLGIPARIMLPAWDRARAAAIYDDAEDLFQTFADEEDLAAKTADADVISATHHKSVALLQAIRARRSDFLPAYYVQDYEPFFTVPYIAQEAIASYTALPDMLLFAKSHWLCNVVAERHGLYVAKVEPSIDRDVFYPAARVVAHAAHDGGVSAGDVDANAASRNGSDSAERTEPGVLRVAAMLRPRTARRQPLATVAVLKRLLEELPGKARVTTFGCYADELREILPDAEEGILEHHRGVLGRSEVAAVLRESDVFLDMSVYQAFGRTALEAMACGATAVLPNVGGAWEFVEHGANALAVDTLGSDGALAALRSLAADAGLLARLRTGALNTAAHHSIARAALSEYLLFERAHRERFGEPTGRARTTTTAAAGIPATTAATASR
jgi:GT2 family glycosyltransferase/glycosyltransferase involved in cell wall biosynthesis